MFKNAAMNPHKNHQFSANQVQNAGAINPSNQENPPNPDEPSVSVARRNGSVNCVDIAE
jgi:hypothetical protein